jgi:hypothetical protein
MCYDEQKMQEQLEGADYRRDEYYKKMDLLRGKFDEDFFKKHYHHTAMFRNVFHSLMQNDNPYKMVEVLIEQMEEMSKRITEFVELHSHRQITTLNNQVGKENV